MPKLLHRSLTVCALSTILAASLVGCGSDDPQPTEAATSSLDWASHIEAVAKTSKESAFSQVDVVGPMVTLTYLDGTTIMNGAGNTPGVFKYRSYDDFQDTRSFKKLSELPVADFAKRLGEQEKACKDAAPTGRLTVTHTGALVERLGCESDTMRKDTRATTINGKAVPTLDALLDEKAITTILDEAKTLHGDAVSSITLTPKPVEEGDMPKAVVAAAPIKNAGGSAMCAQLSTRWTKPGTEGLLLDYADCAPETPTGRTMKLSALDAKGILATAEAAAKKAGTTAEKADEVVVLPSSNPNAFTVRVTAGEKTGEASS